MNLVIKVLFSRSLQHLSVEIATRDSPKGFCKEPDDTGKRTNGFLKIGMILIKKDPLCARRDYPQLATAAGGTIGP